MLNRLFKSLAALGLAVGLAFVAPAAASAAGAETSPVAVDAAPIVAAVVRGGEADAAIEQVHHRRWRRWRRRHHWHGHYGYRPHYYAPRPYYGYYYDRPRRWRRWHRRRHRHHW